MNRSSRRVTAGAPSSGWRLALLVAGGMLAAPLMVCAITKASSTHSVASGASNTSPPLAAASPSPAASVAPAVVSPARAPGGEDIRDIRPPYSLPSRWWWLTWVGAGVGVAVLAYVLWRARPYRRQTQIKSAYELALEELEAARGLMQPERAREFSIRVSEIVREYIEARFDTRAAHRTTEEFLHDCVTNRATPLAARRELLGGFLFHCDLAKFARWVLTGPEMEDLHRSACTFVRETGREIQPVGAAGHEPPGLATEVASAEPPTTCQPQPS